MDGTWAGLDQGGIGGLHHLRAAVACSGIMLFAMTRNDRRRVPPAARVKAVSDRSIPTRAARNPRAPSLPGAGAERHRYLWIAAIVAVCIACYINTLGNEFVLDDTGIIENNPIIRSLSNLPTIFTTDYWEGHSFDGIHHKSGHYRPLTILCYTIQHSLWGHHVAGYHIVNLSLHALNCSLVYLLLAGLRRTSVAVAAALLFAAHPIHTEAVTGIVGCAELLSCLEMLSAMYAHVFWRPENGYRYWVAVAGPPLLYLVGLLAKETIATLPVALLAVDLLHARCRPAGRWVRGTLLRYVAYAGVLAVVLFLRARFAGGEIRDTAFDLRNVTVPQRVGTAIWVLTDYLFMHLWPMRLSADYTFAQVPIVRLPTDPRLLVAVAVCAALVTACVFGYRRGVWAPLLGFGWFLLTILPVSNLFFAIGVLKAERILYIPSIGLLTIVGYGWARMYGIRALRAPAVLLLIVGILLLGARTIHRNRDWRNAFALWSATVKTSPNSAAANYNYGLQLSKAGQSDRAIPYYRKAINIKPAYDSARINLADAYIRSGRPEEAEELLKYVHRRRPRNFQVFVNLGRACFAQERYAEAAHWYRRGSNLAPDEPRIFNDLGTAEMKAGNTDPAIQAFTRAYEKGFNELALYINLGSLLLRSGQVEKADKWTRRGLDSYPSSAHLHYNMGGVMLGRGHHNEAKEYYRQAALLDTTLRPPIPVD